MPLVAEEIPVGTWGRKTRWLTFTASDDGQVIGAHLVIWPPPFTVADATPPEFTVANMYMFAFIFVRMQHLLSFDLSKLRRTQFIVRARLKLRVLEIEDTDGATLVNDRFSWGTAPGSEDYEALSLSGLDGRVALASAPAPGSDVELECRRGQITRRINQFRLSCEQPGVPTGLNFSQFEPLSASDDAAPRLEVLVWDKAPLWQLGKE